MHFADKLTQIDLKRPVRLMLRACSIPIIGDFSFLLFYFSFSSFLFVFN